MPKYDFEVSVKAYQDIFEIGEWYEKESPDLALRFIFLLQDSYDLINLRPEMYRLVDSKKNIHLFKIKKFPYKIYYSFNNNFISILAIIHNARSNKFVNERLK